MPMLVLEGTFRILHSEPDGDSIHFYPTDTAQWSLVPGTNKVRTNAGGGAQLRLDAIDALETHYTPPGGKRLHQPLGLAHHAAARLLGLLGFSGVVRRAETVTAAEPEEIAGYVLTRTADRYGRCVALAGAGPAPGPSGSRILVDRARLEQTVNHALLAEGLVFPTYYRLLYPDLRGGLTQAVAAARTLKSGVWAADATQSGVTVKSLATLTGRAVILPKLFRRLADYLALTPGSASLDGFADYLEQRDDRLWIISSGHSTGFGTVVEVQGQTVRLTEPPENLVFEEA